MATDLNRTEVHRSFRRRPTSLGDVSALPSSSSGEDKALQRPVLWFIPVDNVERFITHRAFQGRLTQGLVFVHNKRPAADILIDQLRRSGQSISCTNTRLSDLELKEFERGLSLKRASRSSKPAVVILDCDSKVDQLSLALGRLAAAPGLRKGIWVRGHVSDFPRSTLRLFDVMFLFDMSNQDSELLRSVISLPQQRLEMLRNNVNPMADHYEEAVLVFTAGADRKGRRLTQIAGNPALMKLANDDLQRSGPGGEQ